MTKLGVVTAAAVIVAGAAIVLFTREHTARLQQNRALEHAIVFSRLETLQAVYQAQGLGALQASVRNEPRPEQDAEFVEVLDAKGAMRFTSRVTSPAAHRAWANGTAPLLPDNGHYTIGRMPLGDGNILFVGRR